MYELATGCYLFYHDDDDILRDAICDDKNPIFDPVLDQPQYKDLTDFLSALLIHDTNMRPSATNILQYGWFRNNLSSEYLISDTIQDIICYL